MIKSFPLSVIDSHTGGEPTRLVIDGVPSLRGKTMSEKRDDFAKNYDWVRRSCVNEPRGYEAMVGALLCEPCSDDCDFGVVFFNNVGYLEMCVHGTIGLAVTLQFLGKIQGKGSYRLDTPGGVVNMFVQGEGKVMIENVPSWRLHHNVEIEVEGYGVVSGDVAWGGNWFFLTDNGPLVCSKNISELRHFCLQVKNALVKANITGEGNAEIDHIEVFGQPVDENSDSRNFVLCPGGEYDRSPCGTGTSAKLACLFADGKLAEGEIWRQASILNTVFEGFVKKSSNFLIPSIAGFAYISGESKFFFDINDEFCHGINKKNIK